MDNSTRAELEKMELDDAALEAVSGGEGDGKSSGGDYVVTSTPNALLYKRASVGGWDNVPVAVAMPGTVLVGVVPCAKNEKMMMVPVGPNENSITKIKTGWFDPTKNNTEMYVEKSALKQQ